jgi:hypothetical protein
MKEQVPIQLVSDTIILGRAERNFFLSSMSGLFGILFAGVFPVPSSSKK